MYIHVYTYIYIYTCLYMYIHVDTCIYMIHFFCQLQTETNEVRKQNRTEVLGPPPEPEFCALSFWNDRGSPLAPLVSKLSKQIKNF